jgi:hypothetical protein
MIGEPRVAAQPKWPVRQKKRLGRRYESYWYAAEKKEWKQRGGWPTSLDDWKKLQGWVVRRKMKPAEATKEGFPREVAKVFRDLYPLLKFTSLGD